MSRSQFQSKRFILRHAWLNLWDERMTTGRINQVAIMDSVQLSPDQIRSNTRADGHRTQPEWLWCSLTWKIVTRQLITQNQRQCANFLSYYCGPHEQTQTTESPQTQKPVKERQWIPGIRCHNAHEIKLSPAKMQASREIFSVQIASEDLCAKRSNKSTSQCCETHFTGTYNTVISFGRLLWRRKADIPDSGEWVLSRTSKTKLIAIVNWKQSIKLNWTLHLHLHKRGQASPVCVY